MTLAAPPAAVPSPLARWDARWRLVALLSAIAATACLQSLTASAFALVLAILLAIVSRVSRSKFLSRLGLIAVSLIPVLIALPFLDGGTLVGTTIAVRALAIGVFAYVLVVSAPLDRTIAAAQSLGLPAAITRILLLTHRYAGVIMDEVRRLRIAWRVRGFVPAVTARTYRTYAEGIGAILVRSGERGERVAAAMRVRGFDGRCRLAVPFHATAVDAIAAAAVILIMIGLALWDRLG